MDKMNVTVPPDGLVVSLDELKLHMRLGSGTDEDDWLTSCGLAAQRHIEKYLEASLLTQTRELITDRFPSSGCYQRLPYAPVQSITHVKYIDGDGAVQTLAADQYRLLKSDERAELWLAFGGSWPAVIYAPGAVTITYVAGWGDAEDVPDGVKFAIRVQAAELYEHREWQITGIPVTGVNKVVENILHDFRNLDMI